MHTRLHVFYTIFTTFIQYIDFQKQVESTSHGLSHSSSTILEVNNNSICHQMDLFGIGNIVL